MGGQTSSPLALPWSAGTVEEIDRVDFLPLLEKACENDNVRDFWEAWEGVAAYRKFSKEANPNDNFDTELLDGNVMKYIRFGLHHTTSPEWREAGIRVARTFLYIGKARTDLVRADFPACLSMLTMSNEDVGVQQGMPVAKAPANSKQVEYSLLAVDVMSELADWDDFVPMICKVSILNFLCIILNQVPEATEKVTETFMKVVERPSASQSSANLNHLREGSVGDILESTFKTISGLKGRPEAVPVGLLAAAGPEGTGRLELEKTKWKKTVNSLSNISRVLATMLKFEHEIQVDTSSIIRVFDAFGHSEDDRPDCLQMLTQIARLLYWVCRVSGDVSERLLIKSSAQDIGSLDFSLNVLVRLWRKAVEIHSMLEQVAPGGNQPSWARMGFADSRYQQFCTDDLDRSISISVDSPAYAEKVKNSRSLLCYLNCLLWLCVAQPAVRWKLRQVGFMKLHLAFSLRESEIVRVMLSTVRNLVDSPVAQQSQELMRFFGEACLSLLHEATHHAHHTSARGGKLSFPMDQVWLLLDTLSVMSLQRGLQELFTKHRIVETLSHLAHKFEDPQKLAKLEVQSLYIAAQVAILPSNRLSWVCSDTLLHANMTQREKDWKTGKSETPLWTPESLYPDRGAFKAKLKEMANLPSTGDETLRTVSSLLLAVFEEGRTGHSTDDVTTRTLRPIYQWWQANSTARYMEYKDADENQRPEPLRRSLCQLLEDAYRRQAAKEALTCMETMRYCAPYESLTALALFSRLALEKDFKGFLSHQDVLEALLGSVCAGIWPEAREAAATLANLMWMNYDAFHGGRLVCWLKFDGAKSLFVDAANVLLPMQVGDPKGVELGKGMYKSTWGITFTQGTFLRLHPDGIQTHQVPGTLTTASVCDSLKAASKLPYKFLRNHTEPSPRNFTLTCWFYWDANECIIQGRKVLVQTAQSDQHRSMPSIFVDHAATCSCGSLFLAGDGFCTSCEKPWKASAEPFKSSTKFVWVMVNEDMTARKEIEIPTLMPGWHHLAIAAGEGSAFAGTLFCLDSWPSYCKNFWPRNDFYVIGNFSGVNESGVAGVYPFGLIADFRIYADTLTKDAIEKMCAQSTIVDHPDRLMQKLASMNAVEILALRLDVPDTAVECLRALGSLATYAPLRSKIFSVCGRQIVKMLNSPYPMIKRQASRVVANMS